MMNFLPSCSFIFFCSWQPFTEWFSVPILRNPILTSRQLWKKTLVNLLITTDSTSDCKLAGVEGRAFGQKFLLTGEP